MPYAADTTQCGLGSQGSCLKDSAVIWLIYGQYLPFIPAQELGTNFPLDWCFFLSSGFAERTLARSLKPTLPSKDSWHLLPEGENIKLLASIGLLITTSALQIGQDYNSQNSLAMWNYTSGEHWFKQNWNYQETRMEYYICKTSFL